MASLRILARSKLSSILHAYRKTEPQRIVSPVIIEVHKRWSSFTLADIYRDPSKYTDFEISTDPKEWQYVERLLPYKVVPPPPKDTKVTASGWKPQNVTDMNLPYFIPRTKNYMQPVYLSLSKRNMRKLTYMRKIQGDIWKLESELKAHLQVNKKYPIGTRINELAGVIIFRGDFVSEVKRWLDARGF